MERYTVIIPTRDRAETLSATIRTCLRQTYKNFHIIVSDNCSVDNTYEVFSSFDDPRLSYIKPSSRLSMSEHFEFALGHVQSGFLMFIGSDDGLLPGAIEYVDALVKAHGVSAVSGVQATYVWPNFPDRAIAGRLTLGGFKQGVEIRNSKEWIRKTISFDKSRYCFDLPSAYCGFVHKSLINKAIFNGRYFHSITPDAYSAFATAAYCENYAYSYKPFVVAGASPKSNGASSMHPSASLDEITRFNDENTIGFMDGYVECPSMEVVCAEAFAQLVRVFPMLSEEYTLNLKGMLALALASTNVKTDVDVRLAVNKMAKNFNLNISNEIDLARSTALIVFELIPLVIKVLFSKSRIIEVPNSSKMGVRDIDDACFLAYLLSISNESNIGISTKDKVLQKIKNLMKLRG